jgi:HAD superfamily phosphatase (TIGR01668 family)
MIHHYPDLVARRFEDIDFAQALSNGRRFLCLDLDNTLLPQTGHELPEAVVARLAALKTDGLAQDVCLISNVIFPGHRLRRLHKLAEALEIKHVVPGYFWNRKPKGAPFRQALSLLRAKPSECVMVGDQLYTDILGGNMMGFYTVWVLPMSGDHWTTMLTGRRRRERKVFQELHRQGRVDPTWLRGDS